MKAAELKAKLAKDIEDERRQIAALEAKITQSNKKQLQAEAKYREWLAEKRRRHSARVEAARDSRRAKQEQDRTHKEECIQAFQRWQVQLRQQQRAQSVARQRETEATAVQDAQRHHALAARVRQAKRQARTRPRVHEFFNPHEWVGPMDE